MPVAAIRPQNTSPHDNPAPYVRLVFLPRLIAIAAFDMVAGPGETATIKKANPVEASDTISFIINTHHIGRKFRTAARWSQFVTDSASAIPSADSFLSLPQRIGVTRSLCRLLYRRPPRSNTMCKVPSQYALFTAYLNKLSLGYTIHSTFPLRSLFTYCSNISTGMILAAAGCRFSTISMSKVGRFWNISFCRLAYSPRFLYFQSH